MSLTFVSLNCGEFTEEASLNSIRPFLDKAELIQIRNVFPQTKALNLMIDKVKTEYFIPFDADFVLKPNAWERISRALDKHGDNPCWHSILFPLWDTLTERKILALKLLRTSIAKRFLFEETRTPDIEHYQRLTCAGYSCIDEYLKEEPIGDHVVTGKHFCYHKYRDVYQTLRTHNCEWDSGVFMGGKTLREKAKAHFDYFFYKYLITGKKDYVDCIAGMIDGITSPLDEGSKSLEGEKYTVKVNGAIETFMNWYLEPMRSSGYMLF